MHANIWIDWFFVHRVIFSLPLAVFRFFTLGYFMSLNGDHLQPKRGGTYAWLISGEFAPQTAPKCMSFYYYLYQRVVGKQNAREMRERVREEENFSAKSLSELFSLSQKLFCSHVFAFEREIRSPKCYSANEAERETICICICE